MKTRIKVYKGESTTYTPQKLDKVWKWSKFKFVDEWVTFDKIEFILENPVKMEVEFSDKEAAIKFLENYTKDVNYSVEYLYPDKYDNN
tara:strand:- start:6642 stop:6905 length:264 start_codon:yes stop_codon:yes gene_type:complete